MNFSDQIKEVSGGSIPNGSIALLYSPTCGYCSQIVPEFNKVPSALAAGGISAQVVAVNVQENFHALRAGGITVSGVPHVLIKTLSGGIIDYTGPRMASNIVTEAATVLAGGENPDFKTLNGGAEDALLGGSTAAVVVDVAPVAEVSAPVEVAAALVGGAEAALEGGKMVYRKKSHRKASRHRSRSVKGHSVKSYTYERRSKKRTQMSGGASPSLEGGRRRRHSRSRSRSRRHHKMGGAEVVEVTGGAPAIEGGRRRRHSRSRSRSRSRKHHMAGGAEVAASLEGGRRRRHSKSRSRSRSRRHHKMGGAVEVSGGADALEGGRRRRHSKSRSRSRRHHMKGGEATPSQPFVADAAYVPVSVTGGAEAVATDAGLEGGKRRQTAWQKHVNAVYNGGKNGMSYKQAMMKASSSYKRSRSRSRR